MKSVVRSETTRTVDYETGEVTGEISYNLVRFPQEPPFIKMYIQDLCAIVGIGDADQALLRHLLARLDYEGFVTLSSRSRKSIADALGVATKTLRKQVKRPRQMRI